MSVWVKRSNSPGSKRQTPPTLKAPGISLLLIIRYNVARLTWRNSAASPIVTILLSSGVFQPHEITHAIDISGRAIEKGRSEL